jgi:hypothetical protein
MHNSISHDVGDHSLVLGIHHINYWLYVISWQNIEHEQIEMDIISSHISEKYWDKNSANQGRELVKQEMVW